MKPDIICGIRAGHYTLAQVEILIQQKVHLFQVLQRAETDAFDLAEKHCAATRAAEYYAKMALVGNRPGTARPELAPGSPVHSLSTDDFKLLPSKEDVMAVKKQSETCHFRVCHTCRPYFRDRIHDSFEKMFSEETAPLSDAEVSRLPIMNLNICLELGTRKLFSHSPPISPLQTRQNSGGIQDDQDDIISTDWSGTSDSSDETDDFPCPGPSICQFDCAE